MRLVLLVLVVIRFVSPAEQAHAEITAGGFNFSISNEEIAESAAQREMGCWFDFDELRRVLTGVDLRAVCFGPPSILSEDGTKQLAAKLGESLRRLDRKILPSKTFEDFVATKEFKDAINNISAALTLISRSAKVLIVYKTKDGESAIFSCAYFTACKHPLGEVTKALIKDVRHTAYEVILERPDILSDLYREFSSDQEYIGGIIETWPRFAAFDENTLNFELALSPCLYSGLDRLCIYDGEFVFDLLRMHLAGNNLALSLADIQFLSGVKLPIRLMHLDRDFSLKTPPSFD